MILTVDEITIFLISISVMLLFARSFGELSRYFKQPIIIGEILAGIILGPTLLGSFFPDILNKLFHESDGVNYALQGLTLLGVIMLLLVSGLEIDLGLIIRQSKSAFLISISGLVFPFFVGFTSAYFFPKWFGIQNMEMHFIFALFVGTALSITALPVVAKTLMDLNIFKTEIGFLVMASAMFDDLLGWIIFSLILGMIGQHSSNNIGVGYLLLLIFVFITTVIIFGRKLINIIIPYIHKYTSFPGGILSFIFILGFLGAAFTEYLGIHAIFGAFIVGIAIGDSVHLREETREIIYQFVTNIFAPLFFVTIGLKVNFIEHFDFGIVIIFLVLAFIGKVVGCSLGAYWGGVGKHESLAIGFGMNSRGAMEIVLGTLALQSGLIQEKVFVALVIMALVTSISSAPIMNYLLKKAKGKFSLPSLLRTETVLFSSVNTKNELLKELCYIIALHNELDFNVVYNEVLKREELISTGLGNYLAIPHARINIQDPLVAVAITKEGIEWNSIDNQPAKFIILLLTPAEKPEVQLKLLSDIAKKFNNIKTIEKIISSKDSKELISYVQQLY